MIVQDIGLFRFIRKHFPDLPDPRKYPDDAYGSGWGEVSGKGRCTADCYIQRTEYGREVKKIADETELEIESFCTWCTLLLLFWSVFVQQFYRRQKWQPWTVRTAVQTALPDTGSKETTVSAES